MEFLYEYGLFIAKAVTIVIAILLVVGGIVSLVSKQKQSKGNLEIDSISERLDDITVSYTHLTLPTSDLV